MFSADMCSNPAGMDDAMLASAVLDICAVLAQVERRMQTLLAEADRRNFWAADGAVNLGVWVEHRAAVPRKTVRSHAELGAALERYPVVADAHLPTAMARLVVSCTPDDPEGEKLLVGLAEDSRLVDFDKTVRLFRAHRDADGVEPPPQPGQSEVTLSPLGDGWMALRGKLGPQDAELVASVLGAGVDRALRARRDGDPAYDGQTVAEIRAEALVDVFTQTMRREPSDASVPDRYRVAVTVRPGESHPTHPGFCDSDFYRAVMTADQEILDIGRTSRQWTTAIRRAITLRDQGCSFPECDRPPSWCDIHHCREWDRDHGHTSLDNGALLCRRHHTFVHAHGWTVHIGPDGQPIFVKPDGTTHMIRQTYRQAEPAYA